MVSQPSPQRPIDRALEQSRADVRDILSREDLVRAGLPLDAFDTREVDLTALVDPLTDTPAVRHWRRQAQLARDLLRRAEVILLHRDRTGVKQAWIKRLLDTATRLELAWDEAVREVMSASQGRLAQEISAQTKLHRRQWRRAAVRSVTSTLTQATTTVVKTTTAQATSVWQTVAEVVSDAGSRVEQARADLTTTAQEAAQAARRAADTTAEQLLQLKDTATAAGERVKETATATVHSVRTVLPGASARPERDAAADAAGIAAPSAESPPAPTEHHTSDPGSQQDPPAQRSTPQPPPPADTL